MCYFFDRLKCFLWRLPYADLSGYGVPMAPQPIPVRLKAKDLAEIRSLLRGGVQQVRVVLRALALKELAAGVAVPQVAQSVPPRKRLG